MTLPRRVLPATTHFVTRRCTQRQFLLLPRAEVAQLFHYVLAYAALRHRIEVHAFAVLSNHYHLVVTDPQARLPRFMQTLNSLLARALNVYHRRTEALFAPGSYHDYEVLDEDATVRKLLYVWANPVAAGLVPTPAEWPGAITSPADLGSRTVVARRPRFFFRQEPDEPSDTPLTARDRVRRRSAQRDCLPERLELPLTIPPLLRGDGAPAEPRALRRRLTELLELHLNRLHELRREQGKTAFLGVPAILTQDPFARPEDPGSSLGALVPRVAGRDPRLRQERIASLTLFWQEHREAFVRFRAGARRTLFPAGSYNAYWLLGARVSGVPPDARSA